MKCSLGISNFLEKTSSLSHSIAFLYFFTLITLGRVSCFSLLFFGTLRSDGCICPFPLCRSLLFFSRVFVRPLQTTVLRCCISFSWRWLWSPLPVLCYEPPSMVLQALCLSDLLPWIYLSLPLYNCKGFDLGHTCMKAMASHSCTLAWKIPRTEEPGRLQPMGSRRVRHDWATSLSLFTLTHWRRKWQPTPVFLPRESQGWGSLVGCRLWGRTESNTTEGT